MEQERLIEETNKIISELVYDKIELLKAYNYYNGKRDAELYRYIEENYGIGNPTSVEFIPLIKKHVDALVGEYLGTPILPKVSCKDAKTITNITREKLLYIAKEVNNLLKTKLKTSILNFINGKEETDIHIDRQLKELIDNLDLSFISLYEIAAQNIIEYIMLSRETDIQTKLKTLLLDLLITGYTYFRIKPSLSKTNITIEVLNPLNTFTNLHIESPYVKNATKAVVRKWLTKELVLSEYGKDLSKEDLDKFNDSWQETFSDTAYVVSSRNNTLYQTEGLRAGQEITPGYPENHKDLNDLIPVYEVEWIETDSDFKMNRYETVRIGSECYILRGLNDKVIRSKSNPNLCNLSVNGVCFMNRNSEPYSLVLACVSLQDKYDLLHFYRDNLIALSGTTGDWIDLSLIPASLGVNLPERILKWQAYKKAGIAPIDTSLEGRGTQAPMNTIFNGYDDTVKVQAIQAILLAIDSVELTTSSITGVFRERLNGIELRDAVNNVKLSYNNSFVITKQYYQQMDLVTVEILQDCLNVGKVVYKNGLTGIIILGDYQLKIFTALPEHFTVSDYDIRVTTSTDVIRDIEQIKALIPEFLRSGVLDPEIIFEAITAKSLSDLKAKVSIAMRKQKEENGTVLKLTLLLELVTLLLQQSQKQLQLATNKVQQLNEAKLKLEQEKLIKDSEIEWYKALTDRHYKNESIALDREKAKIEILQLQDGNPLNDKIRID